MASYPLGFRLAQAIGLTGAAWLAGNISALSSISTPALVKSYREGNIPSSTIAKQWRGLYELGKAQNPPIAAAVTLSFGYLAWCVRPGSPLFRQTPMSRTALFSTAAILTVGIIPFTVIFMSSTNDALIRKASVTSEAFEEDTIESVMTWTTLNQLRGFLPLAGACCGLVASFI
ncbi:DUF1772-domain-containing protein [Penicillium sp. IBT 18751x]|nr:DUF1772-domain-containing protein [Penicillium sp. IBT 18751x]